VNDRSGATSQISGFVTALCIAVTLWFLVLFQYLPKATLAAIIFVAALGLLKELPHSLRMLHQLKAWPDMALSCCTFIVTATVSVETGTLMSVATSILLVLRRTTLPRITILARPKNSTDRFYPLVDLQPHERNPFDTNPLVMRIEQALYFANTGQLKDRLSRLELYQDFHAHPSTEQPSAPDITDVVFDLEHMPSIDASATSTFTEIVQDYQKRSIRVHIVKLPSGQPYNMFLLSGLLDLIGPNYIHDDLLSVLECMNSR
jgi:MFS superfamily sulfate permease-like transporter